MQMIRLFDDMWKKAGLDLNMITYGVVATGHDTGRGRGGDGRGGDGRGGRGEGRERGVEERGGRGDG